LPSCGYDRLVLLPAWDDALCAIMLRRIMNERPRTGSTLIGPVPVRHWTGTVPPPLRYLLAHDVGLCTQVLDIYNAAVFRWLRRKAKAELGWIQ